MPKITVTIEYDEPQDPYWLNPDSIKMILEEYCSNTKFRVKFTKYGNPWVLPPKKATLNFYKI